MLRHIHLPLIAVFALLVSACSGSGSSAQEPITIDFTATPASSPAPVPSPTPEVRPAIPTSAPPSPTSERVLRPTSQDSSPYRITWPQAQEVATVVAFVNAYNAQDLEGALALLADDVEVGDCDYRAGAPRLYRGKAEAKTWLGERFAEHDEIEVTEIFNENPQQPERVVGVVIGRRTSDTLTELGFPAGISPGTPKVIFTASHDRILFWMAGSSGPDSACDLAHHASERGPTPTPLTSMPSSCDVTTPNRSIPPGAGPSPNYHGDGSMWASFPASGSIGIGPRNTGPDGVLWWKFGWWRGKGVRGELIIEGSRLDADAPPLQAEVSSGYGLTGFQASGLGFPTEGCWEVTGTVGETSLTFVIWVYRI